MDVAGIRKQLTRRKRQRDVLEQIVQRATDEGDPARANNASSDIDSTNELIGKLESDLKAALEREQG